MSRTATKPVKNAKPVAKQPKTKPAPVVEKPAPKRQPKAKPVVVEQEEETVSKTEIRRATYEAIENGAESGKPLTLQQVQERFGQYGLSRLAKSLLRGDYTIAGIAQPKKPIDPNDRVARLEFVQSLMAKHSKGKISVVRKFKRRQTA